MIDIDLDDNPVLNMLIVNKWVRENLMLLQGMTRTIEQWREDMEENTRVKLPLEIVQGLCEANRLNFVNDERGLQCN